MGVGLIVRVLVAEINGTPAPVGAVENDRYTEKNSIGY
jgi:hypothetical protein